MMLRLRLGALTLALAVALAACGGSGGAKQPAAPASRVATATTAAPTSTAARAASAVATTPAADIPAAPASTDTPVPPGAPAEDAAPPGATPTAVAGAVADATMQYYDITGATAEDLRASMDARGPVDGSGHRNDAFTAWDVRWTWPLHPDTSCILSGATITTSITVTFPRWLPPAEASASLIERWNAYESALVTHESGHVSFVVATAADVLAAIKGATCETAESAAQAVVARIRQHDIDYDAATNHGFTQGAHFP
jgi:predicted secreted Zn-dependent protease